MSIIIQSTWLEKAGTRLQWPILVWITDQDIPSDTEVNRLEPSPIVFHFVMASNPLGQLCALRTIHRWPFSVRYADTKYLQPVAWYTPWFVASKPWTMHSHTVAASLYHNVI